MTPFQCTMRAHRSRLIDKIIPEANEILSEVDYLQEISGCLSEPEKAHTSQIRRLRDIAASVLFDLRKAIVAAADTPAQSTPDDVAQYPSKTPPISKDAVGKPAYMFIPGHPAMLGTVTLVTPKTPQGTQQLTVVIPVKREATK